MSDDEKQSTKTGINPPLNQQRSISDEIVSNKRKREKIFPLTKEKYVRVNVAAAASSPDSTPIAGEGEAVKDRQ